MLRAGGPGVRVSVLSGHSLSVGVGVRGDAPYLGRARTAGLSVARRTSGGTGVVHAPGDLAWSVVLPRSHPNVGRDYVRGFARLGAGVVRFLHRQQLSSEWVPAPALDPDCCVLSGRGQVLTVGSRVLGGAAQHLSRTALLHQGMIPRTVDRELLAGVFAFPDPTVLSRLTSLEELGVHAPSPDLARQLAEELARDLEYGSDRP